MTAAVVVLAVVVVVLVSSVLVYNGLVRRRDQVDDAWNQIDMQLRRRSDLIPSLVETVDGYAGHERGTLEAVTEALTSLFAVVESYPDLRASRGFLELQQELAVTEDRAAYARQYYNDAVLTYNNAIATVPQRILAAVFRFRAREYVQGGGGSGGRSRSSAV